MPSILWFVKTAGRKLFLPWFYPDTQKLSGECKICKGSWEQNDSAGGWDGIRYRKKQTEGDPGDGRDRSERKEAVLRLQAI